MSKPKSGSSRPHKTPVERSKFYGRFIDESADGVFTCKYCKKVFPKGKDMPNYWTAHVDRCAACQEVIDSWETYAMDVNEHTGLVLPAAADHDGAEAAMPAEPAPPAARQIPRIVVNDGYGAEDQANVAAGIPPAVPLRNVQQRAHAAAPAAVAVIEPRQQRGLAEAAMVPQPRGEARARQGYGADECQVAQKGHADMGMTRSPQASVSPNSHEASNITIHMQGFTGGTLNITSTNVGRDNSSPNSSAPNTPEMERASPNPLPAAVSIPTTPLFERAPIPEPPELKLQAAASHQSVEAVASNLGDRGGEAPASVDEARNQASGSTSAQQQQGAAVAVGGAKAKVDDQLARARMQPQPPAPQDTNAERFTLEISTVEPLRETYKQFVEIVKAESVLAEMQYGVYGSGLVEIFAKTENKLFATYKINDVATKVCQSIRKPLYSRQFQDVVLTSKDPPLDALLVFRATSAL